MLGEKNAEMNHGEVSCVTKSISLEIKGTTVLYFIFRQTQTNFIQHK